LRTGKCNRKDARSISACLSCYSWRTVQTIFTVFSILTVHSDKAILTRNAGRSWISLWSNEQSKNLVQICGS
jgi:hypothetical protein